MTSSSSSQYPSSTTAYPHLNKLLDYLLLPNASTHSFTFTLPTFAAIISPPTTPSISTPLPPISSQLPSSSASGDALSLLPQDAVATSSHLQQFSAVRQLSRDLQRITPRHPKRPQLPPCEAGTPTKRIVHTAVHKQKLTQYNVA